VFLSGWWPARSAGLARTGGGAAEVAVNPQGLAPRNEGLDGRRTAPHTSPDQRSATPGRPAGVRRCNQADQMVLPLTRGSTIAAIGYSSGSGSSVCSGLGCSSSVWRSAATASRPAVQSSGSQP
jgi:hypothetical protein